MAQSEIRLPAIRVQQAADRWLYTFAVDGKRLAQFVTVSRIRRADDAGIEGYQRPEVLAHIGEIKAYLESASPMIPNAIVLAFDSRVRFEASARASRDTDYATTGMLIIPMDDRLSDEDKPGFVVDGQQRLAAIREANIDRFPVCVTAFVTNDVREQAEQFILVNSTKPLPKGLIYELLPTTGAQLPTLLHRRRFPAYLLDRLNREEGSPFRGKIQTPTCPEGIIRDNSILRMLENSLSDGVLYRLRRSADPTEDAGVMMEVLTNFWAAVSEVFSDAWGMPPRRSRLMHGAGIISLGFVMDAIADRHRDESTLSVEMFRANLQPLAAVCRWTDGYWDFGPGCQRRWNELQNTSKDIQTLSNFLLVQYRTLVWSAGGKGKAATATQLQLEV